MVHKFVSSFLENFLLSQRDVFESSKILNGFLRLGNKISTKIKRIFSNSRSNIFWDRLQGKFSNDVEKKLALSFLLIIFIGFLIGLVFSDLDIGILKYLMITIVIFSIVPLFVVFVRKPWLGVLFYIFLMPFERFLSVNFIFPGIIMKLAFVFVSLAFLLNRIIYKKYKFSKKNRPPLVTDRRDARPSGSGRFFLSPKNFPLSGKVGFLPPVQNRWKIFLNFNSPFNLLITLFILWATLSGLWAHSEIEFLSEFSRYVILFFLFFMICNTMENKKQLKQLNQLTWVLIISAFLSAGIYLIENFFNLRIGQQVSHNYMAMAVLMPMIIAFYVLYSLFGFKKSKWNTKARAHTKVLILLIIATLFLSIIVSKSRGGFIGLIIIFIFLVLMSKNKKIIFLIFLILILVSIPVIAPLYERVAALKDIAGMQTPLSLQDKALLKRVYVYESSLIILTQHPFFGIGLGNFDSSVNEYMPFKSKVYHAHNFYLHTMVELGIPGLILLISLIYLIYRVYESNKNKARANLLRKFLALGFLVIFIWFLFDHTLVTAYYFWVFLAIFAIINKQ